MSAENQLKKMLLKKIKRYENESSNLKELVRDQAVKLGDNAERIAILENDLAKAIRKKKGFHHKLVQMT